MKLKYDAINKINIIDDFLKNILPKDKPYITTILKAMDYSLNAGGKRIRPLLCMASFEMFSEDIYKILPFCSAIEMIHTYSLVHDDLPCMDNDDLRRGMPTSHKVFGEAKALLAGDSLLNMAFEVIAAHLESGKCDVNLGVKALSCISNASGIFGMIGGQLIDLESENKNIDIEKLKAMHRQKTGALIAASCMVGGIIGGGNQKDIENLESFGYNLGMAFQIKDDILDVVGDENVLGKPVGSDNTNKKSTFVTHYGLEECKRLVISYTNNAINDIKQYNHKNELLIDIANELVLRNK